MGRPMVASTGLGTPGKDGIEIVGLQALSIVSYLIRNSVRFGTRTIIPVFDPQMMPVTEMAVQEAYAAEGRPEQYNSDDVRFLTNQQFAYAAAVAGTIWREKAAATFYFGYYYAEALILAETGQQVGAIQIAGTTSITQIPFFIASCDYVIIGDEFYAASAYLSREPSALGSLVGQDIVKVFMILFLAVGTILVTISPLLHLTWADKFISWFAG